jgi:hypothetical protein
MSRKNTVAAIVFISLIFASTFLTVGSVQAQVLLNSPNSGYKMTVSYQIIGDEGPIPPVAPTLTYVNTNGKTIPFTLTKEPITILMAKNSHWSVAPQELSGSTTLERWFSTDTLSGKTSNSGSATNVFTFQHQFKLNVISQKDTPTGTGWYDKGATAYALLSQGTVQGSAGTRFVFTGWSGDASGAYLKSTAIIMNGPMTAVATWKTQYQVSFNVNPYNSGTTNPSGTNWYDSIKPLNIIATKKDSYAFTYWTKTSSISISAPTSSTTIATLNGPGTITANFAKPKDTSLTVSAYPKTIDKIGDQATTISGKLTSNGQGIEGKVITLSYNFGTGDKPIHTTQPITTDTNGIYTYDWNPQETLPNGLYIIKAAFAGDSEFKTSSAATSCRGDLTVVPEYLFGGLAALNACFLGFVVFKKRSSLPHFK